MKKMKVREVWDLEGIFPGGSQSVQLEEHIQHLKKKIYNFEEELTFFQTPQIDSTKVAEWINQIASIQLDLSQAKSFLTCLLAQNPKEQHATVLRGKTSSIGARFESTLQKVKTILGMIEEDLWKRLLQKEEFQNYSFILNEWRESSNNQLSADEESLVSELMVDGYHAWGQFYTGLINSMKVKVRINGENNEISVGQAINLRSHPDELVRKASHLALEEKWTENEDLFAKVLNHIAGFRLQMYKKKDRKSVLDEPLKDNRIKAETLHAMWGAVRKYKQPIADYLKQKAGMFGDEKMQSYNFWAPISRSNQTMEYEDAMQFLLERFSEFGTELESFALNAFERGWIEAEDRPNKSAVSFCAGFPLTGESRIYTTFGGRITNVLTVAHELGHAFHNHAMKSVHPLHKKYPMVMAETASTFSELIMLDAALEKAESNGERLFFLDEKLKRSVMNFMNIHSRFLFEEQFYEERKEGHVSPTRLNELMQAAINEAYEGSLENGSLRSWAWTPHFYITNNPFYNFPYTFGYLFSLNLYARAKEIGKDFEKDYLKLLRDSGRQTIEDLVMKHLGEDITSQGFWEKGMILAVKDAQEFISLTSKNRT